jgi:magnesium chelatase family protein
LTTLQAAEKSSAIRQRVIAARAIQDKRFVKDKELYYNAQMSPNKVRKICIINDEGRVLIKQAMEKLNLSARAYDRILKVSRTIADLAGSKTIETEHLAEAIHYRSLDRDNWAG